MSILPEFLQPNNTNEPQKPNPKAGLAEFLRGSVTESIDNLKSVKHIYELIEVLKKSHSKKCREAIVWLDLELNPKTGNLIDGAMVFEDYSWHFDAEDFAKYALSIYSILEDADYLGGHNLINFDLPRLLPLLSKTLQEKPNRQASEPSQLIYKLSQPKTLTELQNKTWDTLLLSSLMIPHQPSHALAKLYKANVHYNDPIMDCVESRFVFELCVKAWQELPVDTQIVFYKLLPAFSLLASDRYFSIDAENIIDIDAIFHKLPQGHTKELIEQINSGIQSANELLNNAHTLQTSALLWQNIGLAAFINWLRYFDKPQARRPVWLKKHPVYGHSFETAERTFWALDNPSEEWINQQCKYFFDFDTLHAGQMSIVKAVLSNKDIPLGILPTGGGKSLTFQLPALIFSKYQRQLTVVISPLKALIEDQVVNLHHKIPDYESHIAYLTSGQTPEAQKDILSGVWHGDIDILYLSPERLRTHSIRQLLKNRPPAFWVLDEAHTLSQWGTDFRPDFLRIADHIIACYGDEGRRRVDAYNAKREQEEKQTQLDLGDMFDSIEHEDNEQSEVAVSNHTEKSISQGETAFTAPTISLVTATASARVKDDLQAELVNKISALTEDKPLVQYGINVDKMRVWRDDITAHFLQVAKDDRQTHILKILQTRKRAYETEHPDNADIGVGIVYLRNRNGCDEYAEEFAKQGLKAYSYHSRLDDSQKKAVLAKFKNNELDVVVCTNAFGMGIDKDGIHTVIHSGPPNNIESYIQEIGRAARKKHEVGEAYMLWSEEDINFLFMQERHSRIPNTKTLNDCWTAIKPTLAKPVPDQWFSGAILSPYLDMDNDVEHLNTQIRVALLALERHGLLEEKDQQPAYISIRLMDTSPKSEETQLAKLYKELRQISDGHQSINELTKPVNHTGKTFTEIALAEKQATESNQSNLNRYHLPELAMVLGYRVKDLLKQLRQLVKMGFAQWQVIVRIRLKYTHRYLKGEFNRSSVILKALKQCLSSNYNFSADLTNNDVSEERGYLLLNTKVLDNCMAQQHKNLNSKRHILPLFRALGILKIRQKGNSSQVALSSTKNTKAWLEINEMADGWNSWLKLAEETVNELKPLFEQSLLSRLPDQKDGASEDFDLDDLAGELARDPDVVLTQLEQLQRLELIELSRLDDDKNAIFFIGHNRSKTSRYSERAYRYLQTHYQDRCARIHVLNHWLRADVTMQQAMIEDYFSKPLQDVVDTYISAEVDATKPYLKDYKKAILPERFSATQASIIKETSRAAMVLAGPGSGKTTVVVHRVAYLLMIEEIKPDKILILAYNRLAVLELRTRLQALIGHHSHGVTIQTFHGLARQITGVSEKEAPDIMLEEIIKEQKRKRNIKKYDRNEARYQWMIEEAIRQLEERPQHYQYIMVDEFQDIDEYQYEMIGLLAGLRKEDDEALDAEVLVDNDKNVSKNVAKSGDEYDQQGYLMVVGDDDQNLYAFRGASIEYIQKFASNYHLNTEQKYYLLDNYRSANNIVALANDFITAALPNTSRLKQQEHQIKATQAHKDSPIRYAFYFQKKGVDAASWLADDISTRLSNQDSAIHQTRSSQPETIAILASQWSSFDATQHYLEDKGITSQRYNESDQLIPINSMVGQALVNYLSANRLENIDMPVPEFLEKWRIEQGYSHLDMAWEAILTHVQGLQDISYEQLLQRLETTFYGSETQVILITYHSAKGMEFDHVYLVDDSLGWQQGSGEDSARKLYVALTRAKRTLTVLQQNYRKNPILANAVQQHGVPITLPKVSVPEQLVFHRLLSLEEIFLTPKDLVTQDGRELVNNIFAKSEWSEGKPNADKLLSRIKYHKQGQYQQGFYSASQDKFIVVFSKKFVNSYVNKADNEEPRLIGFTTTLFYQQDEEYYQKAGYAGGDSSHYLIVPYVRFSVRCG